MKCQCSCNPHCGCDCHDKWIPSDKRKPPFDHHVLLYSEDYEQMVGLWDRCEEWMDTQRIYEFRDITHWRELPEGPR